jgi:hypothetical protein
MKEKKRNNLKGWFWIKIDPKNSSLVDEEKEKTKIDPKNSSLVDMSFFFWKGMITSIYVE